MAIRSGNRACAQKQERTTAQPRSETTRVMRVKGTPLYIETRVMPAGRDHARWRGGFEAGFASERGIARIRNEDSCTCSPTAERPLFCGVADGVGGGAHGDLA